MPFIINMSWASVYFVNFKCWHFWFLWIYIFIVYWVFLIHTNSCRLCKRDRRTRVPPPPLPSNSALDPLSCAVFSSRPLDLEFVHLEYSYFPHIPLYLAWTSKVISTPLILGYLASKYFHIGVQRDGSVVKRF